MVPNRIIKLRKQDDQNLSVGKIKTGEKAVGSRPETRGILIDIT